MHAHLSAAGGGWSPDGPCFPRDNVAFKTFAKSIGAPYDIAETTHNFNREEVNRLKHFIKLKANKDDVIGILGLSYKPNTPVVEESLSILLIKALKEDGYKIIAYDPKAIPEAKKELGDACKFTRSTEECIEKANFIIIMTPWTEFQGIEHKLRNGQKVLDCWRILKEVELKNKVEYIPLGKYHEFLAK